MVNKAAISTATSGSHMPSGVDTFGFYFRTYILHVHQFCLALSPLVSAFHTLEEQCCWLICRSYLYLIEVGLMIPTFLARRCSGNNRINTSVTDSGPNREHIHADT